MKNHTSRRNLTGRGWYWYVALDSSRSIKHLSFSKIINSPIPVIWPFNSATINQVLSPPLSFQRTFTPSLPTRRLAEQKRLELKLIRFPQPRAQLDNCLHSSLIATFRLPRNRGAITPGNEISSATHSWLQYHFLKLCPTVGVGCSSPRRRRTPGHSYPASGLEVTWRFSATRWARGRANLSRPPQRALGLTRGRHRSQSPPGTASGRERRSLHGPAAARGVPR